MTKRTTHALTGINLGRISMKDLHKLARTLMTVSDLIEDCRGCSDGEASKAQQQLLDVNFHALIGLVDHVQGREPESGDDATWRAAIIARYTSRQVFACLDDSADLMRALIEMDSLQRREDVYGRRKAA